MVESVILPLCYEIRRHADRKADTRTQQLVLLYKVGKAASDTNVLLATKYNFL